MRVRPLLRAATLAPLALLLAAACYGGRAPAPLRQADGSRLITADVIEHAHSSNAWDLLRECNTGFRITDSGSGGEQSIRNSRGKSSILLRNADVPLLVVDGVRMVDPMYLRDIPTSSILSIRLLSGIDGATYYGTNAGAGVIIVSTRVPGQVDADSSLD